MTSPAKPVGNTQQEARDLLAQNNLPEGSRTQMVIRRALSILLLLGVGVAAYYATRTLGEMGWKNLRYGTNPDTVKIMWILGVAGGGVTLLSALALGGARNQQEKDQSCCAGLGIALAPLALVASALYFLPIWGAGAVSALALFGAGVGVWVAFGAPGRAALHTQEKQGPAVPEAIR